MVDKLKRKRTNSNPSRSPSPSNGRELTLSIRSKSNDNSTPPTPKKRRLSPEQPIKHLPEQPIKHLKEQVCSEIRLDDLSERFRVERGQEDGWLAVFRASGSDNNPYQALKEVLDKTADKPETVQQMKVAFSEALEILNQASNHEKQRIAGAISQIQTKEQAFKVLDCMTLQAIGQNYMTPHIQTKMNAEFLNPDSHWHQWTFGQKTSFLEKYSSLIQTAHQQGFVQALQRNGIPCENTKPTASEIGTIKGQILSASRNLFDKVSGHEDKFQNAILEELLEKEMARQPERYLQDADVKHYLSVVARDDLKDSVERMKHDFNMDFPRFYRIYKEYYKGLIKPTLQHLQQTEHADLLDTLKTNIQSLGLAESGVVFEVMNNFLQREYINATAFNQQEKQEDTGMAVHKLKTAVSQFQSSNPQLQRYYELLVTREYDERQRQNEERVAELLELIAQKNQNKTPTSPSEVGGGSNP